MNAPVRLALAAAFCVPAYAAEALTAGAGPRQARADVKFVIEIPRVLRLQLLGHPAELHVTEQDVARGHIAIRGPRLGIVANNRSGYVLHARLHGHAFAGLEIDGLPVRLVVDGPSGASAQPTQVGAPSPATYRVEYRLRLAPEARPGRHAWPIALELQDP